MRQQKTNSQFVSGLDIGTGTSCIYPLLGSKLHGWKFYGTDVDAEAVKQATDNVALNPDLKPLVEVLLVSRDSGFFAHTPPTTFSMCNPPFYSSDKEMEELYSAKKNKPASSLEAAHTELVTDGGEQEFVLRMVTESLELPQQCTWYTCMLGKKQTLVEVCKKLTELKVYHTTSSERPGKTKRWFVAWTFDSQTKHETVAGVYDLQAVKHVLSENDIPYEEGEDGLVSVLPRGDVWSRKYKRAKLRKETVESPDEYEFAFSAESLTWKYGRDKTIWDSFSSWMSRQLRLDGK